MAELPVNTPAPLTKPPRRWLRLGLMLVVPLILIAAVLAYHRANDHYISTDNAYLQQDKISVSAELTGKIIEVRVKENQHVNAGDLLFRIDPEPYNIAIAQADAAIASAQVKVVGLETDLSTKGADIASARSNLAFQQSNYEREAALFKRGFSTRARMDAAQLGLSEARGRLAEALAAAHKARARHSPPRRSLPASIQRCWRDGSSGGKQPTTSPARRCSRRSAARSARPTGCCPE